MDSKSLLCQLEQIWLDDSHINQNFDVNSYIFSKSIDMSICNYLNANTNYKFIMPEGRYDVDLVGGPCGYMEIQTDYTNDGFIRIYERKFKNFMKASAKYGDNGVIIYWNHVRKEILWQNHYMIMQLAGSTDYVISDSRDGKSGIHIIRADNFNRGFESLIKFLDEIQLKKQQVSLLTR